MSDARADGGADGERGTASVAPQAAARLSGTFLGRPIAMPVGPAAKTPWLSSIVRVPVPELFLEAEGPRGNDQVDRVNHGGIDKAVLAYAGSHYPDWRREFGRDELGPGGWGENLVIDGLDESSVCIGDRCEIGEARLEVSQPRQPCWKLGARWGMPDLVRRTIETRRTGWYLRVLAPGVVRAGDRVVVTGRPHAAWTVARATAVYHDNRASRADLESLSAVPELAAAWSRELRRRLSR